MDCKIAYWLTPPADLEKSEERVQGKNRRTHEGAGYYSEPALCPSPPECEHDPAELRMTRVPPPPTP